MAGDMSRPISRSNTVLHVEADLSNISARPVETASQSVVRFESKLQKTEDDETQARAAEMQMWWDESIARNMDLTDGYVSVAVLLIKWADHLDDLKTRKETDELAAVFRDEFNYDTDIVELNNSSKPQLQLHRHLAHFVEKHDGPNNLMIVYYTGHGTWTRDEYLELSATEFKNEGKCLGIKPRANWNKAEEILSSEEVEGDILTIMDTCYASNLVKSGREDTRMFELLCACAIDQTTASPGDSSFTRALIKALKDLKGDKSKKPFSTFHLNQKINQNPTRHDTQSHLWTRLRSHSRNIFIAPLKPADIRERNRVGLRPQPQGYLTLRFALRQEALNEQQIDALTKNLAEAAKNTVPILKIDWLGLKPARIIHFKHTALAIYYIAQWRKFVEKKRARRILAMTASPTRKRARDNFDNLPNPKRGLAAPSPPSPPPSEGSHVDHPESDTVMENY